LDSHSGFDWTPIPVLTGHFSVIFRNWCPIFFGLIFFHLSVKSSTIFGKNIPEAIGAFEYFGGVPAVVVPDQLKSGVKTSCKYDPQINPVYAELCAHYGVTVIPARPGEPRDKAKVENSVLIAQRQVLAVLRNRLAYGIERCHCR
jgi:hypothetical protein